MGAKAQRERIRALHRANSFATRAFRHIASVSWTAIALGLAIHYGSSWLGMHLVGETEIASSWQFWYFYLVTAATVGYGDLTAQTTAGRAISVFWIMPGGIVIFSSVVGKLVQVAANNWKRRMLGLNDYSDLAGHTVIIGWHGDRTRRMATFLRRDQPNREVVLASHTVSENPLPDTAHFVHGDTLTDASLLTRAGIPSAGRAIILGNDDNETLAAALAVSKLNHSVHLIAFFNEEEIADLLKTHCPDAECMAPMATELLARAADDPGASRIPKILFSSEINPTLFSLIVPAGTPSYPYGALLHGFYRRHGVSLIGLASGPGMDQISLNAEPDRLVHPGETLYYIGAIRLKADAVEWREVAEG